MAYANYLRGHIYSGDRKNGGTNLLGFSANYLEFCIYPKTSLSRLQYWCFLHFDLLIKFQIWPVTQFFLIYIHR